MALRFKIAQGSILIFTLGQPAWAQTGNCVISGGINNGLQIQNCPIIQAAPTPSFHVLNEEPIKNNGDGTYTRSILIVIDAPYVPNNLAVYASGKTVIDVIVSTKAMMFGGKATDPGVHAFIVSQPTGKYTIDVKTSDMTTAPSLELKFNIDANFK